MHTYIFNSIYLNDMLLLHAMKLELRLSLTELSVTQTTLWGQTLLLGFGFHDPGLHVQSVHEKDTENEPQHCCNALYQACVDTIPHSSNTGFHYQQSLLHTALFLHSKDWIFIHVKSFQRV